MTSPDKHSVLLQPPYPNMQDDTKELYKHLYEIWKRTGGYSSQVTDLNGLTASVSELNTLIGIRTSDTVQEQLNLKQNSADLGSMAFQNNTSVDITGGIVGGVSMNASTITGSNITIPAAGGFLDLQLNGVLNSNVTPVGNVGVAETTLISYTMPGTTLGESSQFIEIEAWGTFAANANNKRIRLKIGTTTILDTTSVAANTGSWFITSKVVRTGSASQQCISKIVSDNALVADSSSYFETTEDLTSALDVFCTGEATSNDDIVQNGLTVKWFNV